MACEGPIICTEAPHTLGAKEKTAAGAGCAQEVFRTNSSLNEASASLEHQVSSSNTNTEEAAAKAANHLWQNLQRYDSWQCPPFSTSQDNFLRTQSGALVDFSGLGSLDVPTMDTPKAGQAEMFGIEPLPSDVLLDAFTRELEMDSHVGNDKETISYTGSALTEAHRAPLSNSSLDRDSAVMRAKAAAAAAQAAAAELDSLDFPPIDFDTPPLHRNSNLISHSSAAGLPSIPVEQAHSSALLPFEFPSECFMIDSSNDNIKDLGASEIKHESAVVHRLPSQQKRLTERQKARGAKGLPVGNTKYEDLEAENEPLNSGKDSKLSVKNKIKKVKKSKPSPKKGGKPLQEKGVNSNRHVTGHGSLKGQKRGGCDYCGALKTPQWRKGPPKDNGVPMHLCNACGVRLKKTGRLDM